MRFPKPVLAADTLHVQTRVLEKRESKSRPNNGMVVFHHAAWNQRDAVVATCRRGLDVSHAGRRRRRRRVLTAA